MQRKMKIIETIANSCVETITETARVSVGQHLLTSYRVKKTCSKSKEFQSGTLCVYNDNAQENHVRTLGHGYNSIRKYLKTVLKRPPEVSEQEMARKKGVVD